MKSITTKEFVSMRIRIEKDVAKAIFDDIEKLMEDIQEKNGAEFLAVSMYNIIQLKKKYLE